MYKAYINTDSYVCHRCSKKNWEPGTVNDYMLALNGWHSTEKNLREVMWRIEMFRGRIWLHSEYSDDNPEENYGMSERYQKWLNKRCNKVKFRDRLCELDREQVPSGYGFMQGYFSLDNKIEDLKKYGSVRIYFKELYDIRQYDKNMNGCYMEISKVAKSKEKNT